MGIGLPKYKRIATLQYSDMMFQNRAVMWAPLDVPILL